VAPTAKITAKMFDLRVDEYRGIDFDWRI